MSPETISAVAFYTLAVVMVIAALAVVLLPRIVHSAIALVLFFVLTSGVYVLLRADFIAAVQVIVYVGAVTVLLLFAIMLTNRSYAPDSNPANRQHVAASVVSLLLLGTLLYALSVQRWPSTTGAIGDTDVTTSAIGQLMLGPYVLPFEIAALLLLVAMIGAIVIAREN